MRVTKNAWHAVPVIGTMVAALALVPAGPVNAALRVARQASVLSLRVTPSSLAAGGGQADVLAHVARAGTCHLKLLSAGTTVVYSHNPVSCASDLYSARILVGPDRRPSPLKVEMELVVRDLQSASAIDFTITVGAAPSTTTTTTTVPVSPAGSPTTTSLPGGPTTSTTTTTTVPGGSTTTTTTTTPLGTTTTTAPSRTSPPTALSPAQYTSSNWSGYAVTGGPYTAATGTFTVPSLAAGATASDNTSEWVGVDGWGNNNLIQAGIDEDVDPNNPQQVDIWPWWEVLPAASTPIYNVSVSAGDQVTVTIWQVSGSQWEISLVDDTNGQTFTTQQSYSGTGQSAEWIVEAPTNGQDNQVYTLAPYSPAVQFTSLGISGNEQTLDAITLVQSSAHVSTPSTFSSGGFSVAYTGTVNGPMAPAGEQRAQHPGQGSTSLLYEG